MANSKVLLADGTVLMDLTGDSVTAAHLESGYTAHGADGEPINGELVKGIVPSGSYGTVTPSTSAQNNIDVTNFETINVAAIPNQKSDSGNVTLNRSTTSKSYAAGYYPNAHGAAHSLGTEGTPTAAKSVSNHTATVTPSVTNTEGYISGGTHSGNPVTVSPADLGAVVPSGSQTKTANGTYDVTTLAQLVVAIPYYEGW